MTIFTPDNIILAASASSFALAACIGGAILIRKNASILRHFATRTAMLLYVSMSVNACLYFGIVASPHTVTFSSYMEDAVAAKDAKTKAQLAQLEKQASQSDEENALDMRLASNVKPVHIEEK